MARPQTARVVQSLDGIAVFKGLPPDTLARLQSRCSWRRYEPEERIIDYLDTSDDVFFIVVGEARANIYSLLGRVVSFCDLAPGDMFGEYAALDGAARSASIEARTSCVVASMSGAAFRQVSQTEPLVAQALLRQLVAKIRTLTTRVYEFSSLAVANRIQAEVLRLAKLAPREGRTARIAAAPTHAEIASRVSTHREAVARELNRLARLGIIERRGRALVVQDVDRLAAIIQEVTGE